MLLKGLKAWRTSHVLLAGGLVPGVLAFYSQGCNLLRLRKNNFPECVLGLNIIFELFPFVDITRTSYYISINFNFIFF